MRAGLLVRTVTGHHVGHVPGRDLDDVRVSDLHDALRREPAAEDVRAEVERRIGPELQRLLRAHEDERHRSPNNATLRELAALAREPARPAPSHRNGGPGAGDAEEDGEVTDEKQPDTPGGPRTRAASLPEPWSRSATISSAASSPTESRNSPSPASARNRVALSPSSLKDVRRRSSRRQVVEKAAVLAERHGVQRSRRRSASKDPRRRPPRTPQQAGGARSCRRASAWWEGARGERGGRADGARGTPPPRGALLVGAHPEQGASRGPGG